MSPVEACRRRDAALVAALRPRLHSFTDAGRMGKRLLPRVVDSYIAVLDLLLQPRNAQQPLVRVELAQGGVAEEGQREAEVDAVAVVADRAGHEHA